MNVKQNKYGYIQISEKGGIVVLALVSDNQWQSSNIDIFTIFIFSALRDSANSLILCHTLPPNEEN